MNGTNYSHRTAITRKEPSGPILFLAHRGMLRGRTLDYGCGKGFDPDAFNMEKFDPYFYPDMPEGTFDTIVCTYVLNVIPSLAEREFIIGSRQAAYHTFPLDYL